MKIKPLLLSIITALSFNAYAYNDTQSYPIEHNANSISSSQSTINYIAHHVLINVNVKQNFNEKTKEKKQIVDIILKNNGDKPIPISDWSIYFGIRRDIQDTINNGFIIKQQLGDIKTLSPIANSKPIKAGESRVITLSSNYFIISNSAILPNWYVSSSKTKPVIIDSTKFDDPIFVKPFTSNIQLKRSPQDIIPLATPKTRFEQYKTNSDQNLNDFAITPTPKSIIPQKGNTTIDNSWSIVYTEKNKSQALALYNSLRNELSTANTPTLTNAAIAPQTKVIRLIDHDVGKEAYTLNINNNHIDLTGKDAGLFYAQTSLLSLIKQHGNTLPNVIINDKPRKPYRGFLLEVARNFYTKDTIFRLLDQMSTYKMNVLHLHLSDDESWRLEIPTLPELTEFGATQCHDISETKCLMPVLGAGPDKKTQYYSVEDYKDILRYANEHHITVIPEFDMPGHARAAIYAMESRYRKLKTEGKINQAQQYRLLDPLDTTQYKSVQLYSNNAINVCLDSTYNFVDTLLTQMQKIHADIQPLKTIHLGGDEIAGAWVNSPACKKLISDNKHLNSTAQLGEYFFNKVTQISTQHKLELHAYGDAFDHKNQTIKIKGNLVAQVWNSIWEWQSGERANRLVNAGYDVILSNAPYLYLDQPQEASPQERGNPWATRFINTEKVFSFTPTDVYKNIDIFQNGTKITNKDITNGSLGSLPPLKPAAAKHILGIEAAVFGETIRTDEQLEYMIYPRLIAVAERAWHEDNWEKIENKAQRNKAKHTAWEEFANRLGKKELLLMDNYHNHGNSIHYRLPMVGAKVVNGKLIANTEYPAVKIQYSMDNGSHWLDYSTPVKISHDKKILLRTSSSNNRYSRVTQLDIAQE
ncbi:family 20 glycosylhydrolase [Photobacterium kishitanii]|uniref:beta-N-acetylhexosaminidase n=2 Tax=Photobacterium kishitanii TaxID=318456 RepID=A0A2T3KIA3_9GAMM|nr:family 20 glycosylhydrolase [Photobacterium kishitanii]PSU98955.1 beta-hexosaminidase [Photobacterium kishitanii]